MVWISSFEFFAVLKNFMGKRQITANLMTN